jgi:acyl carrier protein
MITIDLMNPVFRTVFDNDKLEVTEAMTADDVIGWDSLSHMILISALEEEFQVSFTQKEIRKLKSVGDLLDLINSKL